MRTISSKLLLLLAAFLFVLTACGGNDTSTDSEPATVVVTTTILGDVVRQVVGDQVNVETIMPTGADPHVFQASAKQVDLMMNADLLISNGEGFEERLLDILSSAKKDGVPVFEAMSHVRTIEFGKDDHDDHEHGDDDDGHSIFSGFQLWEENMTTATYSQIGLAVSGEITLAVGETKEYMVMFLDDDDKPLEPPVAVEAEKDETKPKPTKKKGRTSRKRYPALR